MVRGRRAGDRMLVSMLKSVVVGIVEVGHKCGGRPVGRVQTERTRGERGAVNRQIGGPSSGDRTNGQMGVVIYSTVKINVKGHAYKKYSTE